MVILSNILIFTVTIFVISFLIGAYLFWEDNNEKKYEKVIVYVLDTMTLSAFFTVLFGAVYFLLKLLLLINGALHL
jgi:hypothetical protein